MKLKLCMLEETKVIIEDLKKFKVPGEDEIKEIWRK